MSRFIRVPALLLALLVFLSGSVLADFTKGMSLFQQGRFREALVEFQGVVAEYPDYADGYKLIGLCYFQLKEYDKAIEPLKKTLELKQKEQKEDPAAERALGRAFYYQQDFKNALPLLKGASEKFAAAAKTDAEKKGVAADYYFLGISQYRADNPDEALKALQRSFELDPTDPSAVEFMCDLYLLKAQNTKNEMYYLDAIRTGEELLKIRDDASTAQRLGTAYVGAKQYDKAIPHLKKAAEANPQNGAIWYNYGLSLSRTQHWDDAAPALTKAGELLPASAAVFAELGFVYESTKKYHDALAAYEKAYAAAGSADENIKAAIERVKPFAK